MIQGNTVCQLSVRGFCEQIKKGTAIITLDKVQYKDAERVSHLYNMKQVIGGVKKEVYFTTPDSRLRPFSLVNGNICQSWCVKTIENEDPKDILQDDLETYAYHELMAICAERVCALENLNPEVFLPKFTTQNPAGEDFGWYDTPMNTANSKNPWSYVMWHQQAGTPTFKLKSILVCRAGPSKNGGNRENHISIKFAIGRNKFNPNGPKAVMHSKRTLKDLEAGEVVDGNADAKKTRRPKPSAAAKALAVPEQAQQAINAIVTRPEELDLPGDLDLPEDLDLPDEENVSA